MKFGVDVLYKKLSNNWEFREIPYRRSLQKKLSNNWDFDEIPLSENRTFIKSTTYFMSALPAIFRPR